MNNNTVEYNSFIGSNSALILIDGGIMKLEKNHLRYNGYISTETLSGHPQDDSLKDVLNFPYGPYIYQNAQ